MSGGRIGCASNITINSGFFRFRGITSAKTCEKTRQDATDCEPSHQAYNAGETGILRDSDEWDPARDTLDVTGLNCISITCLPR